MLNNEEVKLVASNVDIQRYPDSGSPIKKLLSDSQPLHEDEEGNSIKQLKIRLTKDTWVPHVYKGTSVSQVNPSMGLTCGGQKVYN
jgi:hypothetical protein